MEIKEDINKNLNIINRYVNHLILKIKGRRKVTLNELEQQLLIEAINNIYKDIEKM